MKVMLRKISGIDDAIITMYMSKRSLTLEKENHIRSLVDANIIKEYTEDGLPIGALKEKISDELVDMLDKLFRWGQRHITMLRFIDFSFNIYDLHRAGQDDLDAHAMRYNNRIIRSSTRLADFHPGEMSDYYKGKIIPTDQALDILNIDIPEEIEVDGNIYVKTTNGYILKSLKDDKDVKRGLYMLSIPSSFIFRCNLTEWAHVYKERNRTGTANPEVKECVEIATSKLEEATIGYINRKLLMDIRN